MKSSFFLFALVLITSLLQAQNRIFTREGHIKFFSDGVVEDIEANNYQVNSIADLTEGKIAFTLLMRGFEFENSLMQEHFNEKYVESDKFPKASFEGTFTSEDMIDISKDGIYPVNVIGQMKIHGLENPVNATGTFTVKGGAVLGSAEFDIVLADYGIKIPGVVKDNIAEQVKVTVNCNYKEMPKK